MQRTRRQTGLADLSRAAPAFAALGDPTRLRIVTQLCRHGPQSTTRLTSYVNITRQAVTKHLSALEGAQIIQSSRSGRERIWALQQKRLAELNEYIQQISSQWDAALERLRTMVETE